ncbi:hypothetical protein RSSM_02831 [Rhodopirellula sallentina SM41]|uniref:Uncharacterized protein n=1 Tax=Rhodopirellula sallentina SM41 TaxID=1263870 RepID=M5U3B4_9BACT|nr:hypothetical protein RSSM_02831 [Rhodopirellula sallentina SM41]
MVKTQKGIVLKPNSGFRGDWIESRLFTQMARKESSIRKKADVEITTA